MISRNLKRLSLSLALLGLACASLSAQVAPVAPARTPQPADELTVMGLSPVEAAQVVTVVHRLNGLKMLLLLHRKGEAAATVDDDLLTASNVLTSITAGFALGDGQSIVARLPQAEAEVEAQFTPFFAPLPQPEQRTLPRAPAASRAAAVTQPGAAARWPGTPFPVRPFPSADLRILGRDGKSLAARFVGLDKPSGLSLLRIAGLKSAAAPDAAEDSLAVGQRVRLLAPVRVTQGTSAALGALYLRLGQLEGEIKEIARLKTGKIAHLSVAAQNLSPAIVGAIAINEAGETVGMVEASASGRARIIPPALLRRAAERVLAGQSTVPQPWLGVRGEAVAAAPLSSLFVSGWTQTEAAALKDMKEGILLTSVAPNTPAALADLRPGDVILSVNDFKLKSPEDFSFALNEAGVGATVNFTLLRGNFPQPPSQLYSPVPPAAQAKAAPAAPAAPQLLPVKIEPFTVSVKLSESPNPVRAMERAEARAPGLAGPNPLPALARGIETVNLSPKAAARLGTRGGMLVLAVEAESAAARAGLRVFDVIERVEGRPAGSTTFFDALPKGNPQRIALDVIREGRRLRLMLESEARP
ncbi:MAG TPA: PDZ domain-containing protein [Pyrinomonadaceae bacterium]|jgi:S1-C subfamily serine protease